MILARVVGTVVATRKDPRLEGCKLIIVQPVSAEGKPEGGYIISIDTVGAGNRELVICVSGSSARMAEGCKDKPVDNAIVGIVDSVSLDEPVKTEPIKAEPQLAIPAKAASK
jgi:ethanolamine utilization protein EutN